MANFKRKVKNVLGDQSEAQIISLAKPVEAKKSHASVCFKK
jgi:hypothetical protein